MLFEKGFCSLKNMDVFYGTNAIKFLENMVMIPKEYGCVLSCKTTYIP
jgi:hypothetical protein